MRLRFHWRLVQPGGTSTRKVAPDRIIPEAALPRLDLQESFCRDAERCGIDSLLVDMNYAKPEPLALSLALARATDRVRFMVAVRPGLMSPTLFVQQINTFSALACGRISLNVVAGHSPEEQKSYGDHLDHDTRYARMIEWLSVCHALWDRKGPVDFTGRFYRIEQGRLNTPFVSSVRSRPEIYLGGSSPQAKEAAARHADCWMRFATRPAVLSREAAPLLEAGVEVGLRLTVCCRSSREEAVRSAQALLGDEAARPRAKSEGEFVRQSDARSMQEAHALAEDEWLTPWLWTGLVRTLGAPWFCLVGSPADVAEGFLAFKAAGISQFILSGALTGEEMLRFGADVLPLVRGADDEHAGAGGPLVLPALDVEKEAPLRGPS